MKTISNLLITALILLVVSCENSQTSRMYVGGYTGRDSNDGGLRIIDIDLKKSVFSLVSEADAGPSPSYICVSKMRGMVYAANEATIVVDEVRVGSVTALKLDADGNYANKVKEVYLQNGGPCYVSITPDEDFLLLAHYGSGTISVVSLDGNGLPMEVTDAIVFREEGINSARGHMAIVGPNGKIYFTCLALDKVMIFDLDKITGKLTQTGYGMLPQGAGPRHFEFSKDGTKMFVINELGSSMTVFDVANDGNIHEKQTISTLPEGWSGQNSCADIHLSKDGKYLYGSNRGHNSIVTFKVMADGKLSFAGTTPCGGNHPRNFTLDPSGKYLIVANTNANPNSELYGPTPENIALFAIDKNNGLPIAHGDIYITKQPSCLKFSE